MSDTVDSDYFEPFSVLELDYRLETDLRGDIRAGAKQRISVLPSSMDLGTVPGKLTQVSLDVSFDGGVTWRKVSLERDTDGWWSGRFDTPRSSPAASCRSGPRCHRRWLLDRAGGHIRVRPPMSSGPDGCREGDLPAPAWPVEADTLHAAVAYRERDADAGGAGRRAWGGARLPGPARTPRCDPGGPRRRASRSRWGTWSRLSRPWSRPGSPSARATGYVAAPPAVALGALITDRRDGLRLAEQALASLAEEHRAAVAGQSIDALIEVVTGVDPIRHRYQQVQQAATTELRSFVTAPFVAVRIGENAAEPAAVGRGVRIRAVLERAVLDEPGAVAEVVDSLRNGLELRVAEELPIKLVLADADLALVPLTLAPSGEPGAVLLQRSGLVAALESLFEAVWQRAYPLELSSLDGVPDDERGHGRRTDRRRPADPQPAARRPDRPGRRLAARPVAADGAAPAAPPPGPGRRAEPDAAGLVRRPARLGVSTRHTGVMDPDSVPIDAFEALVEDALESLPDWVLRVVSEIAVFVEDEQEESERQPGVLLLGLYRGVPRTTHYGRAPGTLPDTITLYRIPILEVCARLEDVPDRVRKVLVHEVGHAMGLAEGELRELGWA